MTGIAPVASTSFTAPSKPPSAGSELGADTFLQLLVAQLKYQDPTNPADSTDFLAQTAQFTMVEKLTELAERAATSSVVERNLAAAGMVGRSITWQRPDGSEGEGTVTRATLGPVGPLLTVDGTEVPLDRVTTVLDRAPATTTTTD